MQIYSNNIVSCSELPEVDLSAWKDITNLNSYPESGDYSYYEDGYNYGYEK